MDLGRGAYTFVLSVVVACVLTREVIMIRLSPELGTQIFLSGGVGKCAVDMRSSVEYVTYPSLILD